MVFLAEVFEFKEKAVLEEIQAKLEGFEQISISVSLDYMENVELHSSFSELKKNNNDCLSGIFTNDFLVTVNFENRNFMKIIPKMIPFWIINFHKETFLIISIPFYSKRKRKSLSSEISKLISEIVFGKSGLIIETNFKAETIVEN